MYKINIETDPKTPAKTIELVFESLREEAISIVTDKPANADWDEMEWRVQIGPADGDDWDLIEIASGNVVKPVAYGSNHSDFSAFYYIYDGVIFDSESIDRDLFAHKAYMNPKYTVTIAIAPETPDETIRLLFAQFADEATGMLSGPPEEEPTAWDVKIGPAEMTNPSPRNHLSLRLKADPTVILPSVAYGNNDYGYGFSQWYYIHDGKVIDSEGMDPDIYEYAWKDEAVKTNRSTRKDNIRLAPISEDPSETDVIYITDTLAENMLHMDPEDIAPLWLHAAMMVNELDLEDLPHYGRLHEIRRRVIAAVEILAYGESKHANPTTRDDA